MGAEMVRAAPPARHAAAALAGLLATWWVPAAGDEPAKAPQTKPSLQRTDTKYYVIHSDLPRDMVREAAARMTAMAEEYHRRTKGFGGTIRQRLPFYLFSRAEDYQAAGGMAGTAGVYKGDRLMAIAPADRASRAWHVIQHEGFHQFASWRISRQLPTWINEGLAEYFGFGVWTGDGFVTGVVSARQLKRLQALLRGGSLLGFEQMISMSRQQWNQQIRGENYVQAWAMVHFLVHADGGKYRDALADHIDDIARNRPADASFRARFGRNVEAFQKRFGQWWADQKPTDDLYARATVEKLTSFLARAAVAKQTFKTVGEFFAAAREGTLQAPDTYFLPPGLLADGLAESKGAGVWSIQHGGAGDMLVLQRPDGKILRGRFHWDADGRCVVTVDELPPGSRHGARAIHAPSISRTASTMVRVAGRYARAALSPMAASAWG